ncbi:MAG: hypothetical protein K9L02_01705 [Acholeplasmataceae bacterium]|nr:hypothetical protein [Acholeplasmataceae bacterium]
MSKSKFIFNIFIYSLGIFITGLGVNLIIRSSFGAGPWDAVAENLSQLTKVELAVAGGFVNLLILAFVVLYNKKIKFLIGLIPIIGIFFAIHFWDIIIFDTYYPDLISLKLLFILSGGVSISMGLAAIIVSTFPAMVFDELTIALMKILKISSFFKTRIMIELFAVVLASILGYLAGIGFGVVGLGTLIISFTIGPLISFQMKWMSLLLGQRRV